MVEEIIAGLLAATLRPLKLLGGRVCPRRAVPSRVDIDWREPELRVADQIFPVQRKSNRSPSIKV